MMRLCLRYLRDEDPGWLVFLCFVCSGLVLLPFVLTQERQLAGEEWVWVGALGTVQMALAYGLFANGVRHIKAQEASLISLIEPVLNPIWVLLAWFPLHPTTCSGPRSSEVVADRQLFSPRFSRHRRSCTVRPSLSVVSCAKGPVCSETCNL